MEPWRIVRLLNNIKNFIDKSKFVVKLIKLKEVHTMQILSIKGDEPEGAVIEIKFNDDEIKRLIESAVIKAIEEYIYRDKYRYEDEYIYEDL
jgi:hypothetical protein